MEIILDLGSGNTCQNNLKIARQMIWEIANADNREHRIIMKWQLFKEAGINIPLDQGLFKDVFFFAGMLGYQTTASVFDAASLEFLLDFAIPFVKLANNRALDYLIDLVPRGIPVYRSVTNIWETKPSCVNLACVTKYPAELKDYAHFLGMTKIDGLSDHTAGTELVKLFRPEIWEKHFILDYDNHNPDGGPFAITPAELKEFLEEA